LFYYFNSVIILFLTFFVSVMSSLPRWISRKERRVVEKMYDEVDFMVLHRDNEASFTSAMSLSDSSSVSNGSSIKISNDDSNDDDTDDDDLVDYYFSDDDDTTTTTSTASSGNDDDDDIMVSDSGLSSEDDTILLDDHSTDTIGMMLEQIVNKEDELFGSTDRSYNYVATADELKIADLDDTEETRMFYRFKKTIYNNYRLCYGNASLFFLPEHTTN
jgi:hypothetical protein